VLLEEGREEDIEDPPKGKQEVFEKAFSCPELK